MLAAFVPPYPFRTQVAPYLWFYYRLLTDWDGESSFLITGRDYVRPVNEWEGRWECDPRVSSRLGYSLPINPMPPQHHYAWLDESRLEGWLVGAGGDGIEAFRRFLSERDPDFEIELDRILGGSPSPIEALLTVMNVPSLEEVCFQRGIPVVHVELGPLRGPVYRQTGYLDFRGVNGNTECADRYAASTNWDLSLPREELLRFFLSNPLDGDELPEETTHECGVVLQVEDDSNLVAFGNGMNNILLIAEAREKFPEHPILVRRHPGSALAVEPNEFDLDSSENSLIFAARCRQLLTINSSVGLEAIFLGKMLTHFGDNGYRFILSAPDDSERIRRLTFFLFGYLVPSSLQMRPSYLRFRLSHPEPQAISALHISEYLKQDGLSTALPLNEVSQQQAVIAIRFSNLVRSHQRERQSWQEREAELVKTFSEQAALHATQISAYEAELERQHIEALSIVDKERRLVVEAQQQLIDANQQLKRKDEEIARASSTITALEQRVSELRPVLEAQQRLVDSIHNLTLRDDRLSEVSRSIAALQRQVEDSRILFHQRSLPSILRNLYDKFMSLRITMPLRVARYLLRCDLESLLSGWRRVRNEESFRGIIARLIYRLAIPVVRPIRILVKKPSLFRKGYQRLRRSGLRATLRRVREVLGKQSPHVVADPGALREKDISEVVILTTPHCSYLAELMRSSLNKIGSRAEICFEMPEGGYRDLLHIVICPQMFQSLPGLYMAYQLEQSVSSRWFSDSYISRLEHSLAIFDYSLRNITFLQEKGLSYRQIYHLPVGYIDRVSSNFVDESVDVVFYGDCNNDRRRRYLTELSRHFSVKIISNLFGEELYRELAKAKVIVNIHFYEGALLETTRLFECLSLNKVIVSEVGQDMDEYQELLSLVDFVPVDDVDEMVSRVRFWISDDDRRKERCRSVREGCANLPDLFTFYFLRPFLAHDLITYDQFYHAAGSAVVLTAPMICLGLPETTNRRADFEKDNHYGIQYIPGLRHRIGWVGCGLSYKFLLQRAKDLGFNRILICEDDVEFPDDFLNQLAAINEYLDSREDWDMFSGFIANLHPETEIIQFDKYREKEFVLVNKMMSMVMNIYSRNFFCKIASWDSSCHDADTNTIDRYLESRSDIRVITTPKFLVGHKEDLDSTLWGFNNRTYRQLIEESEALLSQKLALFCANG